MLNTQRSASDIWDAVLGALQLQVTKANYQTWLKDTVGVSCQGGQFVVGVPNTFAKEWLENRLSHLITKNLTAVTGQPLDIDFQVGQQHASDSSVTPASLVANGTVNGPCSNPKYTFSTFIVGNCNRLAHSAAMGVTENPGSLYNPLFVYGGAGLGKTHLLCAIGRVVQQRGKQVLYVTAEQFTNDFIAAIRNKSTQAFRNKYRAADVFVIDDVQFIAGKEQTEESLFHTFNDLHAENRQIILSSDRPPKALTLLEDRLRSRFEWGLIVDIQPPDLETRIAILQARAEGLGCQISGEVMHMIALRAQKNIRELEGALNRVIAFARLSETPVTEETATEALRDVSGQGTGRDLTAQTLIDAVGGYFGIPEGALRGPRRDKPIALARQVAMYLLREEMKSSWTEIGRELGGRDHSTVLHGHDKIQREIEESNALRREILEIRQKLYSSKA